MANCGRCFRVKPELTPFREHQEGVGICKSCRYELDISLGYLEYYGWTILAPGEVESMARDLAEKMAADMTPQPPTGQQHLPESASDGSGGERLPPVQKKPRKGRQGP